MLMRMGCFMRMPMTVFMLVRMFVCVYVFMSVFGSVFMTILFRQHINLGCRNATAHNLTHS